ncbi:MAG: hypothetical protein B7Y41_06185 [Hydrogenophilales bacterium 28-61-23]|nr:MAG: hypothetical protein B7Y41_06185 [Hydrogenophilales bacterium 28-61-23]
MQTTCPECRTTFRVSQDHLGARRGLVRCGTCNAVFNAYDTLLPELEEAPAENAAASLDDPAESAEFVVYEPVPVPVVGADSDELERTSEVMLAEAYAQADLPAQAEQIAATLAESSVADAVTLHAPAAPVPPVATDPTKARESEPDILLQPLPTKPAQPARAWKALFSAALATLLVGLLLLQTAYFLRAELAVFAPDTRPALEWLCQPLNCVVPLPRQLGQDAIAASSLEHDPEQKSRIRLSFLLANRSGQTQAWPRIMLILSDLREAPVAQQVFQPQTYLPKGVKVSAGMPANSEREIRLDFEIGNLVASGYALRLDYP